MEKFTLRKTHTLHIIAGMFTNSFKIFIARKCCSKSKNNLMTDGEASNLFYSYNTYIVLFDFKRVFVCDTISTLCMKDDTIEVMFRVRRQKLLCRKVVWRVLVLCKQDPQRIINLHFLGQ